MDEVLQADELVDRDGPTGRRELVVATALAVAPGVRSVVSSISPSSTRRLRVP